MATDVWTKIDEFEIKVLVLVMMNMYEGNDMRRRRRSYCMKTSDTASPVGEFTAVMLFCAAARAHSYTLYMSTH